MSAQKVAVPLVAAALLGWVLDGCSDDAPDVADCESVTACVSDDDCCPSDCDAAQDNDCTSECGNSVPEPGEDCDSGRQDSTECDYDGGTGSEACTAVACDDGYVNAAAGEICDYGPGNCASHLCSVCNGQAKLVAASGLVNQDFGTSVAISGDVLVVGARSDTGGAVGSGAAYVFVRDQSEHWAEEAKLAPTDGALLDLFGTAVAIDGDTVVVGAMLDDDNGVQSGSAYVFYRDQGGEGTWGLATKLLPADGAAGDAFGVSVAISGDTAVVGAALDDANGVDSGSAYVFNRNQGGADNWGEVTKLMASDGTAGDTFGNVGIAGDTIVVGATAGDANGADSGSAYVFYRDSGGSNAWGQVAELSASDAAAGDSFGWVAISGDTIAVGATGDDTGSVYVFGRDESGADAWGQVKKLVPSDGAADDHFGRVALVGDTLVAGSFWDDDNGENSGSAYVFCRSSGTWSEVAKLSANSGAADDNFGEAVAISDDAIVVAADGDDANGSNAGAVFVF